MKITTKTIHVRVRNLADVSSFVTSQLPRIWRGVYVEAVAENLVKALKVEPEYKYVSRKSAYGKTFVSDKQRRYVMARIREGSITPGTSNRFGITSAGWHVVKQGERATIVNDTEGARWTQNDKWQARQPAMVGWVKAGKNITEHLDKAMVDAIDDVTKAMENVKL